MGATGTKDTDMATETTRTALSAYMENLTAAQTLALNILGALDNHDTAPAEEINPGHVGEVAEIRGALQAISDRLFAGGEYAPAARQGEPTRSARPKQTTMNGEIGNKMAEALAASGVEPALARTLVRSQAACLVCGNGMIVLPWGEVVATEDQVVLDATPANVRVHIHGFCLTQVSAGELIARALGFGVGGQPPG